MSGELRPQPAIAVGEPVDVHSAWTPNTLHPSRIIKVGRAWFTVHTIGGADYQFRIGTLDAHAENDGMRLSWEALREYRQRVDAARQALGGAGLEQRRALHDEDLFAIADLLTKRGEAVPSE